MPTPRKYQPTDSAAVPNEPINHLQRAVLYLSAAVQQFDRIRDDQQLSQKISDLLRLIEEETEVARIQTTGEAVHFMQNILQPTAARPGCLSWILEKLGR